MQKQSKAQNFNWKIQWKTKALSHAETFNMHVNDIFVFLQTECTHGTLFQPDSVHRICIKDPILSVGSFHTSPSSRRHRQTGGSQQVFAANDRRQLLQFSSGTPYVLKRSEIIKVYSRTCPRKIHRPIVVFEMQLQSICD